MPGVMGILDRVYNPPDHIQQSTVYSSSGPSSYTSWSTIQPQTPTTIMSPAINCWSLTSSPPPPHQISAQTTPNQSPPNHQIYQHPPIANLTNLSYPGYYNQDLTYGHYQSPEYLPLINTPEGTAYNNNSQQLGSSERTTPVVYHDEVGGALEKVAEYEETPQTQNHQPESPGSNPSSTPRHEWAPHSHI